MTRSFLPKPIETAGNIGEQPPRGQSASCGTATVSGSQDGADVSRKSCCIPVDIWLSSRGRETGDEVLFANYTVSLICVNLGRLSQGKRAGVVVDVPEAAQQPFRYWQHRSRRHPWWKQEMRRGG